MRVLPNARSRCTTSVDRSQITGLVLSGGLARRMGGVDKGLQPFGGQPLALRAARRLQPQVAAVAINANRHIDTYAAWGWPVWPDADDRFAGPLAGVLAGLRSAATPWLACVPCDGPHFPPDLVARLAPKTDDADVVMPVTLDPATGQPQPQPVFSLLRCALRDDLAAWLDGGGRKFETWARRHRCVMLPFSQPGDATAFVNVNTPEELARWERP